MPTPFTRQLAALAALALILNVGCRKEPTVDATPTPTTEAKEQPAADPTRVEIDPALIDQGRIRLAPVERHLEGSALVLAGDVLPAAEGEAEVGALVSGRIASLEAKEGERVKKGQILAWIESPEVGNATADLLRAQGRAAAAEKKLERQVELDKQNATSKSALDEARAEAQAARAELGAARARIAALGAGAGKNAAFIGTRVAVRAPIDGIVVERHAVLGGPVALDRSLFRIIDPEHLLVRAHLPETAGILPPPGTTATIRARPTRGALSAETCPATLETSFGVVDEPTRAVPIRLRPKGACPWLLPGAYVDVLLDLDDKNHAAPDAGPLTLVIPAEAIVDVRGVPTVFVAGDRPGVFFARPIRSTPSTSPLVPIESGLREGERVVTAGALLLKGELLRDILGGD